MTLPRFLRLLLVTVMLLIGSGAAEAVHLSQDHTGPHPHHHDIDHCAQCFFLMHGQTQPPSPTIHIVFTTTVEPVIAVPCVRIHPPLDRTPRHTRAPPPPPEV